MSNMGTYFVVIHSLKGRGKDYITIKYWDFVQIQLAEPHIRC